MFPGVSCLVEMAKISNVETTSILLNTLVLDIDYTSLFSDFDGHVRYDAFVTLVSIDAITLVKAITVK